MDVIPTLIMATVLAVFGSVTTYLTNRWIDGWRKKDAYKRLFDEPTIFEGAHLHRLVDSNSGVQLLGPCRVTSLAVGRMEVATLDGNQLMTFTGREFERLHPVMDLQYNLAERLKVDQ